MSGENGNASMIILYATGSWSWKYDCLLYYCWHEQDLHKEYRRQRHMCIRYINTKHVHAPWVFQIERCAHVVRCFDDDNVIHVAGKIDPISDIEVINTELALADLGTAEKALLRQQKIARAGDKDAIKLVAVLEKILPVLNEAKAIRNANLDADELAMIKPYCFITAKPTMYVANILEHGLENNPHLQAVQAYAAKENSPVVAVCAAIEAEIAGLDDDEKEMFLTDMGMDEPG